MRTYRRPKIQRERDLVETARLYCQGLSQAEIGERLGVSQRTISKDLREIQRRWQAACVESISQGKARELARIDELERTYWAAWFDSKRVKTSKAIKQEETRDGNPAYLQGVMTCIEKRCKLLGLDAPVRMDGETRVEILDARRSIESKLAGLAAAGGSPEISGQPDAG